MDAELRAEAATDIAREDLDLLAARVPSVAAIRVLRPRDNLRADVNRHVVAVPDGEAAVRLHRLREFVRRRVQLVELDGRGGERGVDVADRGLCREKPALHVSPARTREPRARRDRSDLRRARTRPRRAPPPRAPARRSLRRRARPALRSGGSPAVASTGNAREYENSPD